MGRIKTPQEKKEESYAHDRVEEFDYPHSARRKRPRMKAIGQRQMRHNAKLLLANSDEAVAQFPTDRERLTGRKGSVPLLEHLERTHEARIYREGYFSFRRGYSAARHDQFRRVLLSWLSLGRSEFSVALAEFYNRYLHKPKPIGQRWTDERKEFLHHFFEREPELKIRFDQWLDDFTTAP